MLSTPSIKEETSRTGGLLFFQEISLLLLSSLLFILSFPHILSDTGYGFLAFTALAPVFYLLPRLNWPKTLIYGALSGLITYGVLNYWLAAFHPLAILIVPVIYLFWYLLLFPLLKIAQILMPRAPFWLWSLLWVVYEYLRTQTFVGYSYGVLGYSQSEFLPFIQSASLGGVWLTTLLVIFPSAWLGSWLSQCLKGQPNRGPFDRAHRWGLILYALFFSLNLTYGMFALQEKLPQKTWKTALIQHDLDPWEGGIASYRTGFERLKTLSDKSLLQTPDAVIWSETAFVPAIRYHEKYRDNAESYLLVRQLSDYLRAQKVPFLLGNDHGEKAVLKTGGEGRVEFNAVILHKDGEFQNLYKKIHLVPFTEYFPYQDQLPWIYQALREADTHFWEPGQQYTVFDLPGVKISTPVCFEDTFGDLNRRFVLEGAQVLVNLTNDSWSRSRVAMMQHFEISRFRAVENNRSLVRAANGGYTAAVDPYGRVLGRLEPFTQDYLIAQVPVAAGSFTLYTCLGDYVPFGCLALAVGMILLRLVLIFLIKKNRRKLTIFLMCRKMGLTWRILWR